MQHGNKFCGLYAIVDDVVHAEFGLKNLLREIVLHSQTPVVQLRLKQTSRPNSIDLIEYAVNLKEERPFTLIVNDHAEFLELDGVDGLHLGQEDGDFLALQKIHSNKIFGISTHNVSEAQNAARQNVTYIGCGAVFATNSKSNTVPLGLTGLSEIVANTKLPTVAIGGINQNNINDVAATACSMAAVISGLIENNKCIAQELHEKFIQESFVDRGI